MIGIDPDLIRFWEWVDGTDLPVFIGGSVASSLWGEPRSTLDIDLIVAAEVEDAERLARSFPQERYYTPPVEVIRKELLRGSKGSFNVIDSQTSLKADIYPCGADELNRYGLTHAAVIDLDDLGAVRVAPPTYVIAMKLRYYGMSQQDKHLRDIRGMLMLSGDLVDHAVVEHWARESGTEAAWADCLARPGEE